MYINKKDAPVGGVIIVAVVTPSKMEGNTNMDSGELLPPHREPNMLDLFMTRYDYDYNHRTSSNSAGKGDPKHVVSGEVRNRPIFRMGTHCGDTATTYRTDYLGYNRGVENFGEILGACCHNERPQTAFASGSRLEHIVGDPSGNELCPNTVYKTDYAYKNRVLSGKPQLYAGAKSTAFNPKLLAIACNGESCSDEITPKITCKESLLGKPHPELEGLPARSDDLLASRRPQLTTGGDPTDYYCTSWAYGDKSLAYPSQLPCGLTDSQNGHLIGTVKDKAELLALLSGKGKMRSKPIPSLPSATNPVTIGMAEQPYCAVTRRMENEGHVKMSIYKSDYINQAVLPELPDAAVLASIQSEGTGDMGLNLSASASSTGKLTNCMHKLGEMRNSHGYIHKECPLQSAIDAQTWKRM
ncbi:unnamed protein product, partial [Trypanosoma congolense IL3000]